MATLKNLLQWISGYTNAQELIKEFSANGVAKHMRFIMYCTFLMILFIFIVHRNENMVRATIKMNKEIKEKTWEYKDEKRKLMYMTKESELKNYTNNLGLQSSTDVPKKILITNSN
jgi:hypothetical protein